MRGVWMISRFSPTLLSAVNNTRPAPSPPRPSASAIKPSASHGTASIGRAHPWCQPAANGRSLAMARVRSQISGPSDAGALQPDNKKQPWAFGWTAWLLSQLDTAISKTTMCRPYLRSRAQKATLVPGSLWHAMLHCRPAANKWLEPGSLASRGCWGNTPPRLL